MTPLLLILFYLYQMFYAEASPMQKLFESVVLGGLVACTVTYFEYGIYFSAISGIIALVVTYRQYLKVLDGINND